MPRIFLHFTFILFIITAITGAWMRYIPFSQTFLIEYDNVLHAHSHIAILGWAFLGVFIILLAILWSNLKQKKHAIILTTTIFITSFIMFLTFLYEGYATYSIITSTIHIFVEYWAIYFIYKQLKLQKQLPKISKLFIYGALFSLVLSTIGPFLLGYLGATGLKESNYFEMAIYFYLHFQYNGWLFLFLIGLFTIILHKKKIVLPVKLLTYGFWTYFVALFPWYFSSILWTDVGLYGKILAPIGNVGQLIGVVIIIIGIIKTWGPIKQIFSKPIVISLTFTFLLLFFKSIMELGLISPTLSTLVFDTRSVIIGYLHLTLLGFVSLFILSQYQMVHLIDSKKELVAAGITIFSIGFIINELLLFIMGLVAWTDLPIIPYYNEGLLVSSLLILSGIMLLWFSLFRRNRIY